MARFMVKTAPALGHVNPVSVIVKKLVERGHEVLWICGRKYQTKVESVGARFHPLPDKIDPGEKEIYDIYPELKKLRGVAQVKYWIKNIFLNSSAIEIEAINDALRYFPAEALVADSISYGVFFKSELSGIPSASINVIPPSRSSRDLAPYGMGLLPGSGRAARIRNGLLNLLVSRVVLRSVNQHGNRIRRQLGLPPFRSPFLQKNSDLPSLLILLTTPAFEYPRSDRPAHFRFAGPIVLESDASFAAPAWWPELTGGRKVVLINQGTIANDLADLILPTTAALQDEDLLVIAVPIDDGATVQLPRNVRTAKFIPFSNLLPHVDVMVTNGGYGGTQFALAHGIPLVVAGATEDKMEVAARVEWSGSGVNLRKQRPSPALLKNAVREVLTNPKYRENAQRIQQDFAQYDAPLRAAELIESLVVQKSGH